MCGKDFKYFDQFDPGIRQIKFVYVWENRLTQRMKA